MFSVRIHEITIEVLDLPRTSSEATHYLFQKMVYLGLLSSMLYFCSKLIFPFLLTTWLPHGILK